MSFASMTKKELTQLEVDPCCSKAELAALIRMNGSLSFGNKQMILDIQTENAAIARRIYSLIKTCYPLHVELLVRKKMRLKKNNVYIVRISNEARKLLEELKIMEGAFSFTREISPDLIEKDCCKRAYLRGAFLAGGSVNHPETSSYHLEIFSLYEEHNDSLRRLMNHFHLNAKMLERKKGFILYLKEGERISDFLNVIGAHQSLLRFEDVRIMKDMRNSVNRLVNCETANLNKTVGAAMRQVENIRFIKEEVGLDILPDKLREIAELRINHQDVTLKELGEMVESGKVSKSGVNHRLRKIDEYATKLRAGEKV
ncbi:MULTISPECIES: DNA-binding protein WhiA [Alteribacter]|uniref:Probable cell division protein WhiA n=1 Tax=Alteribacter keqinensis TaxID=2483800 RepID=A0A3M7TQG0_9BACI|nr:MULTISPECIES: DNA-binding protein WhiA [Alteribacter]MBM7096912.1 DNA-binding protein WhiA [Alteribacter salitolerans]RNA67507.1 DNA-binding protein WhiA [Alteribacter keqinensis]